MTFGPSCKTTSHLEKKKRSSTLGNEGSTSKKVTDKATSKNWNQISLNQISLQSDFSQISLQSDFSPCVLLVVTCVLCLLLLCKMPACCPSPNVDFPKCGNKTSKTLPSFHLTHPCGRHRIGLSALQKLTIRDWGLSGKVIYFRVQVHTEERSNSYSIFQR